MNKQTILYSEMDSMPKRNWFLKFPLWGSRLRIQACLCRDSSRCWGTGLILAPHSGLRIQHCCSYGQVAAVAGIQSLASEISYDTGATKKRKKKRNQFFHKTNDYKYFTTKLHIIHITDFFQTLKKYSHKNNTFYNIYVKRLRSIYFYVLYIWIVYIALRSITVVLMELNTIVNN